MPLAFVILLVLGWGLLVLAAMALVAKEEDEDEG